MTAKRNKRAEFLVLSFLLLFTIQPHIFSEIIFSPSEWDLGEMDKGVEVRLSVNISNSGTSEVSIELIGTCNCFFPDRYEIVLPPGGSEGIILTYDTSDDTGEFEKFIIIRTSDPDLPKGLFRAYGSIRGGEGQEISESSEVIGGEATADLILEYYYTPTCRSCIEFLEKEVPSLEKKIGVEFTIRALDVLEGENFEVFQQRMKDLESNSTSFPVLVIGTIVLKGDREIEEDFDEAVRSYLEGRDYTGTGGGESGTSPTEEKLLVLPVVFAGLLDGVNPCAFTTLIFLLAALALAGKSRREVLIIGIFFTLSVFITYSLIGLGFFKTLRLAGSFPVIARIIRYLLVAVLVLFAGISIYDYVLIRRGDPTKIILQLPKAMKRKIHNSVRTYTRSGALIGSSVLMGFFVSVFELGCTGQVYFPTIAYLVQVKRQAVGYLLLGIYNLGFILPLIIVFILTYKGVSSEKITGMFQRHMGKVKIGTAFLFLGLAVLTILT